MPATVQEVFAEVQALSRTERLRLATLILQELTTTQSISGDDAWSEQDRLELTAYSLRHAAGSYSLEQLLALVNEENIHAEVETGSPVGKEIW